MEGFWGRFEEDISKSNLSNQTVEDASKRKGDFCKNKSSSGSSGMPIALTKTMTEGREEDDQDRATHASALNVYKLSTQTKTSTSEETDQDRGASQYNAIPIDNPFSEAHLQ